MEVRHRNKLTEARKDTNTDGSFRWRDYLTAKNNTREILTPSLISVKIAVSNIYSFLIHFKTLNQSPSLHSIE